MRNNIEKTMAEKGMSEQQVKLAYTAIMQASYQISEGGFVPLQAMIVTEDETEDEDNLNVILCPEVKNDQTKDMFMETIRFISHTQKAKCVALVMEVWIQPKDKTPEEMEELKAQYQSISQMPGRREAICIIVSENNNKFQIDAVIERDSNDQITNISELNIVSEEEGKMSGRMARLEYTNEDILAKGFNRRLQILQKMQENNVVEYIDRENNSENHHKFH